MKNSTKVVAGTLLALLTTHVAAEDDVDPEVCVATVEKDGLPVCITQADMSPWLDPAWTQTGANTWTDPMTGETATWVETGDHAYEIVEPATVAAQQGAEVPLPPAPPPPPPPSGVPPPLNPPPSSEPPVNLNVGDYDFGAEHWPQTPGYAPISGRTGPHGVTRMVARPPTPAQLAELELVWSAYKAAETIPRTRSVIVVDALDIEPDVPDDEVTRDESGNPVIVRTPFFEVSLSGRGDRVPPVYVPPRVEEVSDEDRIVADPLGPVIAAAGRVRDWFIYRPWVTWTWEAYENAFGDKEECLGELGYGMLGDRSPPPDDACVEETQRAEILYWLSHVLSNSFEGDLSTPIGPVDPTDPLRLGRDTVLLSTVSRGVYDYAGGGYSWEHVIRNITTTALRAVDDEPYLGAIVAEHELGGLTVAKDAIYVIRR